MRLAALLLLISSLALAGCGGSSEESTTSGPADRPEPVPERIDRIRSTWERSESCERPQEASRWGCSVGTYRCQAVVVDRGWSVSCAKAGESIAFRVTPG